MVGTILLYYRQGPVCYTCLTLYNYIHLCLQAKGFPDVNTRLLLRRLWETFHIPIFALVDADPHGK